MGGGIRKPGAVQNKRKTANQVTQHGTGGRAVDQPVKRPIQNRGRAVPGQNTAKAGTARAAKSGKSLNGKATKMNKRYKNKMQLEILSKSNNEAFARITVAAFAAQLDPTIEELSDIKTAVSEAVTNSIIHGYENKEGIIRINAYIYDNVLRIEIADQGKGIEDIEIAKQPLYTTKPELERSGMGFTIMDNFMDNLKVESVVGMLSLIHI